MSEFASWVDGDVSLPPILELAEARVEQTPPPYHGLYEDENGEFFKKQAIDQEAGKLLAEHLEAAENPQQFIETARVVASWLQQSTLDRHPSRLFTLPTKELRHGLLDKVITSGWVNNYNVLPAIAEEMVPLLQPAQSWNASSSIFAKGTKQIIETTLQGGKLNSKTRPENNERLREDIVFFSALTDSGALDENMWGKVGIERFDEHTPFAVTEEVHRRFVINQGDSYAPLSERTHLIALGKYCYYAIKQLEQDRERHQHNVSQLINALQLERRGELKMPLQTLIRLANGITHSVNRLGGTTDADGVRQTHELLSEKSRSSVGEALNRILQVTRPHEESAVRTAQEYRDSIHVEIVNELSTFGAKLPHTKNR